MTPHTLRAAAVRVMHDETLPPDEARAEVRRLMQRAERMERDDARRVA